MRNCFVEMERLGRTPKSVGAGTYVGFGSIALKPVTGQLRTDAR